MRRKEWEKLTIATVRTWLERTFGEDDLYLQATAPPLSKCLANLSIHTNARGFAIEDHVSKAILVANERLPKDPKDKASIWAVMHIKTQRITYYRIKEKSKKVKFVGHCPDNIAAGDVDLVAPFKGRCRAELKALLFFFFLDCGAVGELTSYGGFYDRLEIAFRRHIDEEKKNLERQRLLESPPNPSHADMTSYIKSTLLGDFCDLNEGTISRVAERRLRALVCYLTRQLSQEELDPCFVSLENSSKDRESLLQGVPTHVFREVLPDEERFAPCTTNVKPTATSKPAASATVSSQIRAVRTAAKRPRDDNDAGDPQARPAKRVETESRTPAQHECHAIHEQVVTSYAGSLKDCNQLRADKSSLEARISELDTVVRTQAKELDNEKSAAAVRRTTFLETLAEARNWRPRFEEAQKLLQGEKDRASALAKTAKDEDEAAATILDKHAKELAAAAAKKRAKHA